MKRIKPIVTAGLCLLLGLTVPLSTAAGGAPVWITDTESGEKPAALVWEDTSSWDVTPASATAHAPEIGGKSALLMDLGTGTVLYEKHADKHLPIASVTKIMTLLLVMEALDSGTLHYEDVLTCSDTAASMGGSQIWLEPGEQMSVDDLLKAVTVVSANDACVMFAEALAGSAESFVALMNRRAAELGMTNTEFHDCSGLDDTAYSCAYDVALMARALMEHPAIVRYTTIWMDTLRDGASQLVNTNKLIRHYSGATGLKTGTTSTAGHNLAATATRDGLSLVAVMLGCDTTAERFDGTRKLLDYGFATYTTVTPTVTAEDLVPVPVTHGTEAAVTPETPVLSPVLLEKSEAASVRCTVTRKSSVAAPVTPGQTLGEVQVKVGNKVVATYPLCAAKAVPKLGFFAAVCRLFAQLSGL